jgi:hypothetical protein
MGGEVDTVTSVCDGAARGGIPDWRFYGWTDRRTSTWLSRTLTWTAGWGQAVGPLRAAPSESR